MTSTFVDARERKLFYAMLAAFTIVRMVVASLVPLSGDEAYYWSCSRNPDWSYFDQPAVVIWLMIPFRFLLGETALAVRMPAILASLGIGLLLPPLVRRLGGGMREATTAYLWMSAMPMFVIGSFYVSTDIMMTPFFVAATWAAVAISQGERRAWWGFGVAIGVAFLSKFPGVLVLPAILAALTSAKARQDLKTPTPWLAGLVAFAITAPVWIWGAQHDWANIEFQLSKRHEVHALTAKYLGEFLGANLLLASPFLAIAFVPAWWRAIRRRDAAWLTVAVAAAAPFAAFGVVALRERVGAHWGAPGLILLAVLFALQHGERPRRKLAIASGLFGGILGAVAITVALFPGLVLDRDWTYPGRPNRISTKSLAAAFGNEELLAKVEAIRRPDELVACESYTVVHILGFLSKGTLPIVLGDVAGGDHGLASLYWMTPDELRGRNVLFVSKHKYSPEPELRKRFASVEELPPIDLVRNGELVRRFVVFRCTNLLKPEGAFTLIPAEVAQAPR
jgi:4-amino-4-deoxy-L-arabinose transferase-like glycosyltransferase